MQLSLSNGIFSKLSLTENFATVKQLGFENIEFNMKTVKKENDTAVYTAKELFEASGLNCLTLHSAALHVKDEVEVHRAVYYGKISLEFARRLKAPIMTVHSNISKKLSKPVREKCLTEIFSELNDYSKTLGIKLALENLSYTSTGYGKNVEQLEEILNIIDGGDMGITLDFCHALETKQIENLLEKYGRRVCNVHMANKAHRPFTKETPQLTAFLTALHGYGYQGPITLEIEHKTPIEEIAKTKSFFEKTLEKF
ncbi:MAG: sugar phosphate isomerase/epimerase [Candidatus Bathyarchaeota archaeon]|nr:sugar phosphate isomerase/epimerase [Candidatus Bathyarchaeota archaeon]